MSEGEAGTFASRRRGPREVVAAEPGALEEEFLYHLSRGSEFLIANRVVEAKEELERALSYQPLDARSQDLLASVYFRLGVYPRAIEIWTHLVQTHGDDTALRVNLGLALLKTAQPELALGHLARAVSREPGHERAWRYVGLAEWRVGNLDRAREAFLRGGQASMARRMEEMLGSSSGQTAGQEAHSYIDTARLSLAPPSHRPEEAVAEEPVAREGVPRAPVFSPGTPRSLHPGLLVDPISEVMAELPPLAQPPLPGPRTLAPAPLPSMPVADLEPTAPLPRPSAPPGALRAEAALDDEILALTHDGVLIVRPRRPVFTRKSGLRAIVGALPDDKVPRKTRSGQDDGVLGDQDPLHRCAGQRVLHFAPPPGERFELLRLEGETVFIVERSLFGFDEQLNFESGQLPSGVGPQSRLLQLRGRGLVALRLERALSSIAVRDSDEIRIAAQGLVGWSGHLYPGLDDERWITLRGEGVVYFV